MSRELADHELFASGAHSPLGEDWVNVPDLAAKLLASRMLVILNGDWFEAEKTRVGRELHCEIDDHELYIAASQCLSAAQRRFWKQVVFGTTPPPSKMPVDDYLDLQFLMFLRHEGLR